jgi:hypothetical protein
VAAAAAATSQDTSASGSGRAASSNATLLLLGHDHLVRYVEAFTTRPGGDVWLVFKVTELNST